VHSHAKRLSYLNADPHIFVSGKKKRVSDGPIASKLNQVCDDE
jgi:uncharacterized protein YciI